MKLTQAALARSPFLAARRIAALALTVGLAWPVPTEAATLAYESYNYSPGTAFANTPTATTAAGFTGNFTFLGEDLNIAPGASTIGSGSLGYTDSNSNALTVSNNQYQNGHGRLLENLNTTGGGPFASYLEGVNLGANHTTLYISFAMQIGASPAGYNGFELFRGTSADSGRIASVNIWTGHGSGNYFLTVGEGANGGNFGGSGTSDANLGFSNTSVNFFVLRLDFGAAGTDTLSIYANPLLATEPGAPTGQVSASDLSFDRISNSTFGGGAPQAVDEIRVGTTYASVTTVPEPSTMALLSMAAGAVATAGRRRRGARMN